jgi:hypothetical protein
MDYEIIDPIASAWYRLYGIPHDQSDGSRMYLFSNRPSMSKRIRFFEKPFPTYRAMERYSKEIVNVYLR